MTEFSLIHHRPPNPSPAAQSITGGDAAIGCGGHCAAPARRVMLDAMVKRIVDVVAVVAVAAIAITISLWLTPMQTVQAVGQTVRVGAAAPTASWSGPGEVDLFGQKLDTTIDFPGPIRPRFELTDLQLSENLADLVGPGADADARRAAQDEFQDALVDGWRDYLIVQVLIVAAFSLLLIGAVAGWQRRSARASITMVIVGVLVAAAANVGAVVATAVAAAGHLRDITSVEALVGAPSVPMAPPAAAPPTTGSVVVIGDSTAAGIGNPPLPNPSPDDTACERTSGSFAVALGRASDWDVTSVACSSATIRDGLLGEQHRGDRVLPPQLPAALASAPAALVVSVGANDVGWSHLVGLCATLPDCGGNASDAYFHQQLESFTRDYLVLLTRLRSLADPPTVVINTYYDPLPDDASCVRDLGITEEKADILHGWLGEMNTVLAEGAEAASFPVARPSFDGHGLCSPDPFVQPLDGKAPLHPTTAGGLAIALADQKALLDAGVR
ncbi:GDSL-type esterase/lipase family protein [Gordonia shandongensis]|uniref:GDSL-type esterase/lipase family protein n=1 Tax=Gordonia shandongensis TaxID=376351 RepID=UPI00146D566E|nr:GDSL-type esterase/lipase family protein [Gordonia shandongensis]